MPEIKLNDPGNVTIDGEAAGSVVDALDNHGKKPGVKAALLAALHADRAEAGRAREAERNADREAFAAEVKAVADRHAGELAAAQQAHADEIARLKAEHEADGNAREERHRRELAEAKAEGAAVANRHAAEAETLRVQVDALGGTELAMRLRAERELAEHERTLEHAAERAETLRAQLRGAGA